MNRYIVFWKFDQFPFVSHAVMKSETESFAVVDLPELQGTMTIPKYNVLAILQSNQTHAPRPADVIIAELDKLREEYAELCAAARAVFPLESP